MRILYVIMDRGIPIGGRKGAGAHVRALAKAFIELGNDITIVAREISGPEPLPTGVNVVHFSTGSAAEALASLCEEAKAELNNLFFNVDVYEVLTKLMQATKPDVVIERLSLFSVAALAASRAAKIPYLLEVNSPLADEATKYRKLQLHETAHLLERTLVCGADMVLPVSTALRDWAIGLGASKDRVRVIANGVDTKLFNPLITKDKRRELGLEGAKVIGFVGSLRAWHGIDLLLEAFSLIADHNGEARLLIVGDGPARKNVEFWRKKSRTGECVLHIGSVPQPEVPGFLATMDVVLVPYEKIQDFYFSPLKVLESMSMGKPTVAAAIGDIPRLIEHEHTGLLVPPGDAKALAAAAERLLSEPDFAKNIGAAARKSSVRNHDWLCVAGNIARIAYSVKEVLH